MTSVLKHLDDYGTAGPDFNEGHPEDRCPLDGRAVDEHQGRSAQRWSTVWAHRIHAATALLLG